MTTDGAFAVTRFNSGSTLSQSRQSRAVTNISLGTLQGGQTFRVRGSAARPKTATVAYTFTVAPLSSSLPPASIQTLSVTLRDRGGNDQFKLRQINLFNNSTGARVRPSRGGGFNSDTGLFDQSFNSISAGSYTLRFSPSGTERVKYGLTLKLIVTRIITG